jgi:hypothetical protein
MWLINYQELFADRESYDNEIGFSFQPRAYQKSPLPPLYERGIGGDFRDGLANQDLLLNFRIFHVNHLRQSSRTFGKKPKAKFSRELEFIWDGALRFP